MQRLDEFTNHTEDDFYVGKNSILKKSWIDYEYKQSTFFCGVGTQFIDSKISLKKGGRLIIGDGCEIRGRIIVEENASVIVGHGLICNAAIKIQSAESKSISIGIDCLFSNISIFNSDMHSIFDAQSGNRINISNDVVIGNRVWAASDVLVLKGSNVSADSVIGAGAVVRGNFPKNSVISGNPAKVTRSDIFWSRHLTNQRSKIDFGDDFSLARLKAIAQAKLHDEVISMAFLHFDQWCDMDKTNYYIFYYLARAIFESKFIERAVLAISINNKCISLINLRDIFLKSFEVSERKNYPCGTYVFILNRLLKDDLSAKLIFDEIAPVWPQIKQHSALQMPGSRT